MPPGDEYHVGGGRLKLKGSKVTDGRIEKKKKKKSKEKKAAEAGDQDQGQNTSGAEREPEYDSERKNEGEESALARREGEGSDAQREGDSGGEMVGKTEAERKYEEQRKKRLQERLKREGVKTHKERVEELNKYLSRLTEHHDMPKIGPG